MRRVRGIDRNGKVEYFKSVSSAALSLGVSGPTLGYHLRNCIPFGGVMYEYDDVEEAQVSDGGDVPASAAPSRGRDAWDRYLELKDENDVRLAERRERAAGNYVHRVSYELKYGVIAVTPCMYREHTPKRPRPKVGSTGCMGCHYFRGRSKVNRYVLCVYSLHHDDLYGVERRGRPSGSVKHKGLRR